MTTIPRDQKSKTVFIVHGRDINVVSAILTLLKSMGLNALDFSEVRLAESFRGRYIGEVLDHAFDIAQAIIVLLSGEETVKLRAWYASREDFPLHRSYQPRPNVLIETGMALRSHADRTVIVEFPPVRPISDLGGLVTLRFDGDENKFLQQLSASLRQAGCEISKSPERIGPVLRTALRQWRFEPVLRSTWKAVAVAVVAVVAILAAARTWIAPNWCGPACKNAQEAAAHHQRGTALWLQADANKQYSELYKAALDEYYKAMRQSPDNPTYRASVAATLNDLGEYDRTITELAPFTQRSNFRAVPDGSNWLLAEIAAAYGARGDQERAEQYRKRATDSEPHLRDWIARRVARYQTQDKARRADPGPRQNTDIVYSSGETSITFQNQRIGSVDIYWIIPGGQENLYATLSSNQQQSFVTYVGHRWIARDRETGAEIARATGTKEAQIVRLKMP